MKKHLLWLLKTIVVYLFRMFIGSFLCFIVFLSVKIHIHFISCMWICLFFIFIIDSLFYFKK